METLPEAVVVAQEVSPQVDSSHNWVVFEIHQSWNTGKPFEFTFNPPLETIEQYAYQFTTSDYAGLIVRGAIETRGSTPISHRQLIQSVSGTDSVRPVSVALYQSFPASATTADVIGDVTNEQFRVRNTSPVFYKRSSSE